MASDGSVLIKITGDDSDLQSTLKSTESTVKKSLRAVASVVTAVGAASAAALSGLAAMGVTYNSQMEDYTANFKVMLGSAEDALAKVEELKAMAAKTPFAMADLSDATQTLLAFQIPAEESTEILQMLGDVALGNKEKLSGLATVFGQVSSAGKLQGQDLMQMINQGFNPLNYISQRTGESMEQLRKRMSDGAISAEEVTQAFRDATSEGGQFYKGMETASKTVSGLVSTLKDDAKALIGEVTQPISDELRDNLLPAALDSVSQITEAFEKDGLSGAVEAFGDVLADTVTYAADLSPELADAALDMVSSFAKGLWKNRGKIGETVKRIVNDVLDKVDDAVPVLRPVTDIIRNLTNNLDDSIPVIKGVLAAMAAYEAAKGFIGVLDKINAATNPISTFLTVASALIGLITALGVALNDEKNIVERATAADREAAEAARERRQSYTDMISAQQEAAAADLAQLDNAERLYKELATLADENGNVEEANRSRAEFILGELNKALGTEYEMTDGQIQAYCDLTESVYDAIEAKRAEILLTSQEALYREAVEKTAEAEEMAAQALKNRNEKAQLLEEAQQDLVIAESNYQAAMADTTNVFGDQLRLQTEERRDAAAQTVAILQEQLNQASAAYDESQGLVNDYYHNMSLYEQAYAASLEGNTQEVQRLLKLGDAAYLESESFKKQSLEQQKADYEEYLRHLESQMEIQEQTVRDGGGKTAEAALEETKKQHEETLAEYNRIVADIGKIDATVEGENLSLSFAKGIRNQIGAIDSAVSHVASVAKKGLGGQYGGVTAVNGTHATGLDYVPFDGYIAQLHKGEMILPADIARRMRAAVEAENSYTASLASRTADVDRLKSLFSPGGTTTTNNYNHTAVFNSPKAMSWRDMRLYQESQRQQLELLGV